MSAQKLQQWVEDKVKVSAWLDHIGEHDAECRKEVLKHCKDDNEARDYYVGRYSQECAI